MLYNKTLSFLFWIWMLLKKQKCNVKLSPNSFCVSFCYKTNVLLSLLFNKFGLHFWKCLFQVTLPTKIPTITECAQGSEGYHSPYPTSQLDTTLAEFWKPWKSNRFNYLLKWNEELQINSCKEKWPWVSGRNEQRKRKMLDGFTR